MFWVILPSVLDLGRFVNLSESGIIVMSPVPSGNCVGFIDRPGRAVFS